MKVRKLIPIIESTLAILKHYENTNVPEMLKDIERKVKETPIPMAGKQASQLSEEDYSSVVNTLEQMEAEQLAGYLKPFKKRELVAIGKQLGLKLSMKETKATLIDSISNHFSFIQLNEAMANRKNH